MFDFWWAFALKALTLIAVRPLLVSRWSKVIFVNPVAATPLPGEASIPCGPPSVPLDPCGYAAVALALFKSYSAEGCVDVLGVASKTATRLVPTFLQKRSIVQRFALKL